MLQAGGPGVLAIFAVTSLLFAKEHRADKGRGLICVCPTVGKAQAQELEQERQDGDSRTEMCARSRYVFSEAANDSDMFGRRLQIASIFQPDRIYAKRLV